MGSEGAKRAGAVLIVEDEPLVRAVAADVFMDFGYRVFEACDVADALTILEGRDDIAAVFTDIEMPGTMNGLDLAAAIRQCWSAIAVLVTSGRVHPGAGMLPVGADFIPKPYLPSEAIDKMKALMVADHHE